MPRRVVLFDVGGPLDTEFAWEIAVDGAIASACGLEGIPIGQTELDAASDAAVEAHAPDAYAHMVETLCGGEPTTVARVRARVRAILSDLEVFQLRPGMDGLLDRLVGQGLRLGIVANQPARARERLERAGILRHFSALHLSGREGARKPDPSAFLAVTEVLGVAPADCVMVGDRIDNDIAPARQLGMAAILLRSGRHRRQRPRDEWGTADAEVRDVPGLEEAIGRFVA